MALTGKQRQFVEAKARGASNTQAALKAGRLMLREMRDCVEKSQSFAFETTLSGVTYLQHIHAWKQAGYHVSLFFLSLPNVNIAIARVAERVRQGGHNIPELVIRRRFSSGLQNFHRYYRDAVDTWILYDNAGATPVVLEWGENT